MLPQSKRLTRKKDFIALALRGRSVFGLNATLRVVEAKRGEVGKIAFITSTKVFKRAVDRNRAKRRLREATRSLLSEIPVGVNVLFIAKPEARDVEYKKLVADIHHMIERIPGALLKPVMPSSRGIKHRKKMEHPRTNHANHRTGTRV